jgi:Flp pilus assembly protein TadG
MPLLMLCIFFAVQFSLTYLGNQVVSSVARETSRAVRQGADAGQANAVAVDYARRIGSGVISNLSVTVTQPDADTVRVRVTADTLHLVGIESLSRVSAEVQGPLETFRVDTGG